MRKVIAIALLLIIGLTMIGCAPTTIYEVEDERPTYYPEESQDAEDDEMKPPAFPEDS